MATEYQGIVGPALESLGFEGIESEDPEVMGGPQKYTLPDAKADALKGKTVILDSDGSVIVE